MQINSINENTQELIFGDIDYKYCVVNYLKRRVPCPNIYEDKMIVECEKSVLKNHINNLVQCLINEQENAKLVKDKICIIFVAYIGVMFFVSVALLPVFIMNYA